MRILYFADIRFPLERANGIQTFHTCHALARRGHEVELVVRPDTARPARDPYAFYGEQPVPGLTIERVRATGQPAARRTLWLLQALGRAVRPRSADVALTRDLGFASLLLRLPRNARPPVVYESHGFAPRVSGAIDDLLSTARPASERKQARLAAREARVWRRAEGYVAITASLAAELGARFGSRSRLAVIPDGVRLDALSAPARAASVQDPPVVGYAGHLYPWKGVEVLLRSIALLPSARALIVGGLDGEPDLGRLRGEAVSLGIGERVTFAGAVAPPEVPRLLAQMDVLVLPNTATHISSRYTSPLKLFEYMAAGRPIVASDLPSLGEVLRHDENAILVEPGNETALAAAISRVLADASLASRLAAAAREDVRAYSWDRRAERLEELMLDAARATGEAA